MYSKGELESLRAFVWLAPGADIESVYMLDDAAAAQRYFHGIKFTGDARNVEEIKQLIGGSLYGSGIDGSLTIFMSALYRYREDNSLPHQDLKNYICKVEIGDWVGLEGFGVTVKRGDEFLYLDGVQEIPVDVGLLARWYGVIGTVASIHGSLGYISVSDETDEPRKIPPIPKTCKSHNHIFESRTTVV